MENKYTQCKMVNFLQKKSKLVQFSRAMRSSPIKPSMTSSQLSPLKGLAIGIPINILSYTFTNLHYGYDITNIETSALLVGLGYFTYTYDRVLDGINNKESKGTKYDVYREQFETYLPAIVLTYGMVTGYLSKDETTYPFLCLINSTLGYKMLKKKFGELKALYIGVCWCVACQIIPCVIHDGNYEILQSPIDYVPLCLTLFGYSNIADIDDRKDDKLNGIRTLAVKFGEKNSRRISLAAISIASGLILINPHFGDNVVWNTLYEAGNIGFVASEAYINSIGYGDGNSTETGTNRMGKIDIITLAVVARLLGI